MKKTMALILAALFVAVSFSGCGTGPNLGFTYQELGAKLESQFQADQAKLSVGEWERSNYTKENCYLHFSDDLYIAATCANKWSESVINLSATLNVVKEIGKTPKATEDYIYLIRTIYKALEPDHTAEQEEEFERIIINAVNYPVMERFTCLTQGNYKYVFRPKTEWFSFMIYLAE